ncbi:hypothetical protein [Microbispora amethystogenes]|uniref:hypothetical protein n=1 Tax=Microbispora amethystogenes TaxID=1427754 RepID=UPI0019549485|nr:hypothetical protein [Microbispora amethystogenes]
MAEPPRPNIGAPALLSVGAQPVEPRQAAHPDPDKSTEAPVDVPELERLEHLRGLLPAGKVGALPKLLLFARSGFSAALVRLAGRRPDVELVHLDRLYGGD